MRHIPVDDSTEKNFDLFVFETLSDRGDLLMDLLPCLDIIAGGVAISGGSCGDEGVVILQEVDGFFEIVLKNGKLLEPFLVILRTLLFLVLHNFNSYYYLELRINTAESSVLKMMISTWLL